MNEEQTLEKKEAFRPGQLGLATLCCAGKQPGEMRFRFVVVIVCTGEVGSHTSII